MSTGNDVRLRIAPERAIIPVIPGLSLAGIWGLGLALAGFIAMTWPRNLHDEAKELRNKVSAALGPALAQDDAENIYR